LQTGIAGLLIAAFREDQILAAPIAASASEGAGTPNARAAAANAVELWKQRTCSFHRTLRGQKRSPSIPDGLAL
jgi:hypothetical protein